MELQIKKLEAVIEAILFTMGDAVELERIAAAVEHDEDTTRKVIRSMMTAMRKRTEVSRLLNWMERFRCVPNPLCMSRLLKLLMYRRNMY